MEELATKIQAILEAIASCSRPASVQLLFAGGVVFGRMFSVAVGVVGRLVAGDNGLADRLLGEISRCVFKDLQAWLAWK